MIQKPPQLRRMGLIYPRELAMVIALAAILYLTGAWNPEGIAWKKARVYWFKHFGRDTSWVESTPVYWYVDEKGTKHFVTSLGKVPQKYRSQVNDENDLPDITRKDFVLPPPEERTASPKRREQKPASSQSTGSRAGDSSAMDTTSEALSTAKDALQNFKNFVGTE